MNFSILDWNIEGSKYYTKTNLKKIIPHLEKSPADIFCLQEAHELREKLPTLTKLKNFNYVFPGNNQNRNIILSKFPIITSGELIFPQPTLENITWADIKIDEQIIRIYNCHLEITGVGPKHRIDQLKFILEAAGSCSGPIIICGDMNTTIPSAGFSRKFVKWFHRESVDDVLTQDERHLFLQTAESAGFTESINLSQSTWCIMPLRWEIFKLKLDWFLVRNLSKPEISLGNYISDHRSILAKF